MEILDWGYLSEMDTPLATKQLNLTIPKHEEKQPARCSRACQLPA